MTDWALGIIILILVVMLLWMVMLTSGGYENYQTLRSHKKAIKRLILELKATDRMAFTDACARIALDKRVEVLEKKSL